MRLLTVPFRAARDFVAETRFRQAQLKGKVCPACGGRDVVGDDPTHQERLCCACGHRWLHIGGESAGSAWSGGS